MGTDSLLLWTKKESLALHPQVFQVIGTVHNSNRNKPAKRDGLTYSDCRTHAEYQRCLAACKTLSGAALL